MTNNSTPKKIAVLGATGSIGSQALDIISRDPSSFKAVALTAGSKVDALIEACIKHRPSLAVIADESKYARLKQALEPFGIECAAGADGLIRAASLPEADTVLTATVGYSGLAPTIAAIRSGKDIALANKETLVVAGEYVTRLLAGSKSKVYPVDSEHSAIFQCLRGEDPASVRRLLITASGGPFRTWTRQAIEHATVTDALRHPNWSMGAKITIDSATMLNKAFEIIEARWLFGVAPDRICALVHPQSIIHSMVEFADGAVKAQLGMPDMRLPIAYALGEEKRTDYDLPMLGIEQLATLTFSEPDTEKFPCLTLGRYALEKGGTAACVINAANEIAVAAFLRGALRFVDIYRVIERALEMVPFVAQPDYDDYVSVNAEARARAAEAVAAIQPLPISMLDALKGK